jgi:hypothetical protein
MNRKIVKFIALAIALIFLLTSVGAVGYSLIWG